MEEYTEHWSVAGLSTNWDDRLKAEILKDRKRIMDLEAKVELLEKLIENKNTESIPVAKTTRRKS